MSKELVSIDDIAKKFKQNHDSCLFSSILFSLALQYMNNALNIPQKKKIISDIEDIINGSKGYSQIQYEIGYTGFESEEKQNNLHNYMASSGYTIEMHRSSRDQLIETIDKHPLIYLLYPDSKFFNMITPIVIQHVISAVRINDDNLVIFEPYAGEIREREISHIEKFWSGIGVVKEIAK